MTPDAQVNNLTVNKASCTDYLVILLKALVFTSLPWITYARHLSLFPLN